MPHRVLCTALGSENGPHFDILRQADFDVAVVDRSLDLWNPGQLLPAIQGASAIIAGSEPYPRQVLSEAPGLRLLARMGVGFDAIDVAACDELGIHVATTPGVNHDAVAEHAVAMLMGTARDFPRQDRAVRRGRWIREAFPRVAGSTLGIVGLGRIGRAVAWRAAGLGMKIVAYEPVPDESFCRQWNVAVVSLDELLERSDYVSLHCPGTPENKHLINAERLARMKPGSVLINTARGPLVDEPALIAALSGGHLRAAGLDVYEKEPLSLESPLIGMDNVLLAGHTAGLDCQSHHATYEMGAETIVALSRGEAVPNERIQNGREIAPTLW